VKESNTLIETYILEISKLFQNSTIFEQDPQTLIALTNEFKKIIGSVCVNFPTETQLHLPDFFQEIKKYFFPKMNIRDLLDSLVLSGTSLLERDPMFDLLTKKILLMDIYYSVFKTFAPEKQQYQDKFIENVQALIEKEILDPKLSGFNLQQLSAELDFKKDEIFNYIGLETLKSRYLLNRDNNAYETPQFF
jgi:hypothetical protein